MSSIHWVSYGERLFGVGLAAFESCPGVGHAADVPGLCKPVEPLFMFQDVPANHVLGVIGGKEGRVAG
ncbi:hypothetical protein CR155_10885 [Pollutimonas nitritireducens]|uniref:Uncharacterized protein n=1 Tax=Pollutimonas nitritireducens TaxID=2045209 RepID=A0A2N4UFZ5_9BURK|nr:hypothetical protein [Pollutimonas nitritireducens]PLC53929.1 hypothetical protein CR155_10885 [Pollutimonas nitritireducens]